MIFKSSSARLTAVTAIATALAGLSAAAWVGPAWAHEAWVLTPDQMVALLAEPAPEIFASVTPLNLAITLLASAAFLICVFLDSRYAEKVVPALRIRTVPFRRYLPLFMRLSLATLLVMAALGLMPRHGTPAGTTATLLLPDLELMGLAGNWHWLGWVQLLLAMAFAFGLYVRAAAAVFMALNVLGLVLFGPAMFEYLGHLIAPAVYLLFFGSGPFAPRLPAWPGTSRLSAALADQPQDRVMLVIQVMVGATFVYMGVGRKLLEPNLIIGVLDSHNFAFLGIPNEICAFCMAMVETVVGMLIMFGVMLELVTIVLVLCFLFMAVMLNESLLMHIHIYAAMAAFFVLGAGNWSPQSVRADSGPVRPLQPLGQAAG